MAEGENCDAVGDRPVVVAVNSPRNDCLFGETGTVVRNRPVRALTPGYNGDDSLAVALGLSPPSNLVVLEDAGDSGTVTLAIIFSYGDCILFCVGPLLSYLRGRSGDPGKGPAAADASMYCMMTAVVVDWMSGPIQQFYENE